MKLLQNILNSNFGWKELKYSGGDIKKKTFLKKGLILWDVFLEKAQPCCTRRAKVD